MRFFALVDPSPLILALVSLITHSLTPTPTLTLTLALTLTVTLALGLKSEVSKSGCLKAAFNEQGKITQVSELLSLWFYLYHMTK